MVDTNNRERRKYNINDNKDMNTNHWINGLLAWWSGFSLRTKLLAIATLVVSLLMTGITFFALNSIQRDAGMMILDMLEILAYCYLGMLQN